LFEKSFQETRDVQKPVIDIKDFAENFFKKKHYRKTVFHVAL